MNDQELLNGLENHKLIDIARNYKQYGYDESLRNLAFSILCKRGFCDEELIIAGINHSDFEEAEPLLKDYQKDSFIAFVFWTSAILLKIGAAYISIDSIAIALSVAAIASSIFFFVFLIRSLIDHSDFYKAIKKDLSNWDLLIYFLVGMPFYIVYYWYFKNRMKDELRMAGT